MSSHFSDTDPAEIGAFSNFPVAISSGYDSDNSMVKLWTGLFVPSDISSHKSFYSSSYSMHLYFLFAFNCRKMVHVALSLAED